MTLTLAPFTLSAYFSGLSVPARGPHSAIISQKEFNHDVATLQIWADDVDSGSYYSGMPMQLVFGRPGRSRTFYGYVNHAERSTVKLNPGSLVEANSTTVYCVGASWWMKAPGTQSWTNQTVSQVIESIAQQFGLDSQIVPHPTVWPTLQMAGMSYWQFCVSLAQRVGYTFYCNGVQLIFKPRVTDPNNLIGYVRSYDWKANPSLLPVFKPVVGANSPSGGQLRNRQMASINPRTKTVSYSYVPGNPALTTLGSTPDIPLFTQPEHFTADSLDEANAHVSGAGLLNQLYMSANAVSVGDPYISQGSLIDVRNVNGAQDGLWFVESAQHCFSVQTYELNMLLGRDSRGTTSSLFAPISTSNVPSAVLSTQGWWRAA